MERRGINNTPQGRERSPAEITSEFNACLERFKDFMTKVLEKEKVDKFYIAGLSQGSHVATVVADIFSNSERVQGVIMMCPYMPFGKAHEVFNNGPKVKGNYLMEHPLKGDISVVQALPCALSYSIQQVHVSLLYPDGA